MKITKKFLLVLWLLMLFFVIAATFLYKPMMCPYGKLGNAIRLKPSAPEWVHPIWPRRYDKEIPPRNILQNGAVAFWIFADDILLNAEDVPLVGFSGQFRNRLDPQVPIEDDIIRIYKSDDNINFSYQGFSSRNDLIVPEWSFSIPWQKDKWNFIVITWEKNKEPQLFFNGEKTPSLSGETILIPEPVYFSSNDLDFMLDIGKFRKSGGSLPVEGVLLDEITLYNRAIPDKEVSSWYYHPRKAFPSAIFIAHFDESDYWKFRIEYKDPNTQELVKDDIFYELFNFENAPIKKCNIIDYLYFRKYYPNLSLGLPEEEEVASSPMSVERVNDCSKFKTTPESFDINTVLEPPPLFSGLPWQEISDTELEQSWADQDNLSYIDTSSSEFRYVAEYAELKIRKGWSIKSGEEYGPQIKEYYHNEFEKSGWSWKVTVHGFEIQGIAAGGPMGNVDGYLKVKNGYLREIIFDERSGPGTKFSIFISDIVALKDIVPQYSPATYLGAFYAIVTPQVQRLKDLPVDYGALIYSASEFEPAILSGSPAEKAGLQRGDIILAINKQRIDKDHPFDRFIQERCPSEEVILRVLSGEEERDVPVILGEF